MSADADTTTAVLEDPATHDAALETTDDAGADAIAEALEAASALADSAEEVDAAAPIEAASAEGEVAALAEALDAAADVAEDATTMIESLTQHDSEETPDASACDAIVDSDAGQPAAVTAESVRDADTANPAPGDPIPHQEILGRLKGISGKVARAVARIRTLEQENHEQARAAAQAQEALARAQSEREDLQSQVNDLTIELARYRESDQTHAALDEIEKNLEAVGV